MRSLRARLRAHVTVPLYWSAYSLMLSVIGSSVLGMLFWVIASRAYAPEVVGVSSAAVAALMFLTGIGGLYLDGALYRFLPRAGEASGRLIAWTTIVTLVGATLTGSIFLLGVDVWTPALSFATSSWWAALASVAAVVGACLLMLEDGALIGLRRAGWVPIKNIGYAIAKIVVLGACIGLLPSYGILVAWVVPSALVVVAAAYLLAFRLVPRHRRETRANQEAVRPELVTRYAAGNYVGFLCNLAYRSLPPILVLHELGARASAYFYAPWLISTSLALLTNNLSVSLVVEGALDRRRLALQTRRSLVQVARLLVPIAALLFLTAPYVLRVFGARYAENGAGLLRLLAIGLVPTSVSIVAIGVARVQDRVRVIITNQVVLLLGILGLGVVLLHAVGIEGLGLSWLISQTIVATWLAWTQLRPALAGEAAPVAVAERHVPAPAHDRTRATTSGGGRP